MRSPTNRSGTEALPQRADARRNRDTILSIARDAFAEGGHTVSMAEIARRSGIGMATLYRNFPNRQALLEALYTDNLMELARSADDLEGGNPWDALATRLHAFANYFGAKQALASELLGYGEGAAPVFSAGRDALFDAARPLLERAQQSGDVRPDATLDQVMDLVVGVAKIPSTEPGYVSHILHIALDGLRTRR
jgi:AcrR family transcriptional regulator